VFKRRERIFFNSKAERVFYESESDEPTTLAQLEFLKADMRHWVPEKLSPFKGLKVLDLGAGKAPLGTLIARDHAPALAVSFDLGFHRLRSATVWREQYQHLSLVCGDAFALPFKDGAFDYVIANSVLHHLPNVDQAIAEIRRVLHPGGFYIGREPNYDNPAVRFYVFKWLPHTPNEYPLRAQEITDSFHRAGFQCQIKYFWRRWPALRHPIFSAAMSVVAQRL